MAISGSFMKTALAMTPLLTSLFAPQAHAWDFAHDRYEECGGRKIERRVFSWQTKLNGESFGIDFRASEKKVLTF